MNQSNILKHLKDRSFLRQLEPCCKTVPYLDFRLNLKDFDSIVVALHCSVCSRTTEVIYSARIDTSLNIELFFYMLKTLKEQWHRKLSTNLLTNSVDKIE